MPAKDSDGFADKSLMTSHLPLGGCGLYLSEIGGLALFLSGAAAAIKNATPVCGSWILAQIVTSDQIRSSCGHIHTTAKLRDILDDAAADKKLLDSVFSEQQSSCRFD